MNVAAMRQALIERYSPVIRNQRVEYMPEQQVVAIYRNMIERRDPAVVEPKVSKRNRLHDPVQYEQLRMEI